MNQSEPEQLQRPKKHMILFILGLVIFIVAISIFTWRILHKTTKPAGFTGQHYSVVASYSSLN